MKPTDFSGVALKVGPFNVYSLCIMLGMIASIFTIWFFWRREKYPFEKLAILIFIALPTAMAGARLFFLLEQSSVGNWSVWKKFYAIWEGGLSIQGGVITAALCCISYITFSKSANKIDIKKAFSIIIPAVLIGQAIGRWGNFANHEVYGGVMSEDSLAFRILPDLIRKHMYIGGKYRLPLFLYESIANLVAYVIICWVLNYWNWLRPGTTGGIYLVYYGILRTGMEPLREESFKFYTVLSVSYIILGLFLILMFEFINKLNYNVYKIPVYKNEKLANIFYFLVYEPKYREMRHGAALRTRPTSLQSNNSENDTPIMEAK
ncbi:Prolipoprotein diacylglyceryl transferase [Metamycoplasma arthritidis]|uniref:Phosphatidylglycerol--prolipoprotein diacylglyceryl transferase n=1 Tax=Metamycoplasma arthritidis (strain 158L3-1) TaxID=243272 RepID=B3PMS8_META1|nr:prolipoprotein diacylglyceryl transferase [Metamycoplasma arthritidis]ACF07330.1 prolipoprotein diacylglyceryl transferase [Metamycoplasma arthritidis 158L3-1]VEU78853.1 Prolipoprotein diacylglyceryl transferase [Metamycoplasma arthritidis]